MTARDDNLASGGIRLRDFTDVCAAFYVDGTGCRIGSLTKNYGIGCSEGVVSQCDDCRRTAVFTDTISAGALSRGEGVA